MNVGSVARLCTNFGVNQLRLVAPRFDPDDPQAMRMAVKGAEMLKNAPKFSCLKDAVADCQRIVATCGRKEHGEIPLHPAEQALPWLITNSETEPVALVFGREDHGLTNDELLVAQKVLTIETDPLYPSLNLSHAVAVVLHELHRHQINNPSLSIKTNKPNPASSKQLEEFLVDAKALLLEVGFLMEHTTQARMAKVRGLLQRAAIQTQELALIRGMLRQIRWAINSRNS